LLGTVSDAGTALAGGNSLMWTDMTGASSGVEVTLQNGDTVDVYVTENPTQGDTEEWNIYNFTEDAHPIHLHLVRFAVVGRAPIGGILNNDGTGVEDWETGFKDTVIAYPGEITTVKALFDIAGLYVWHCHIVEHEDNEMMRPYVVSPAD
jgi:FtsP/CotA-like multicopper oxidase with cupredoxin domain